MANFMLWRLQLKLKKSKLSFYTLATKIYYTKYDINY